MFENLENKRKIKSLKIFEKAPIEIQDGWTDLVYELGKDITELCELTNCELPHIQQVKSKYSHLKFYYNCLNSPYPEIVKKSIGALVKQAENKSETTCEYCGNEGETRVSTGYWFTACDEHKKESITVEEWQELKRQQRIKKEQQQGNG